MAHAMSTPFQAICVMDDLLPDVGFEFTSLPTPIPASLRPSRRIALLLILVEKSHASGASWKGLQLLNWMVRDPRHAELVNALWEDRDIPDRPVVRFEPALERAIDLAVGLDLVQVTASRAIRLTAKGKTIVEAIGQCPVFERERAILGQIPGKVTRTAAERALQWRDQ